MAIFTVKASDVKDMETEYRYFLTGNSGRFTTNLFSAFSCADHSNFMKLASAFPVHAYIMAKNQNDYMLDKFIVIE